MGVMSRQVVPVCGNLCVCCPSMRASSRQPVKRYKKLLADIFPRNQEADPNDRKIGKLCDYASKNPLRIPKITNQLEQRCYKDLRSGNLVSVKVVLSIYRKLLKSCKDQMPLFATSLLGIVRTLLEQTYQAEMQSLGCIILVEFISSQKDSTYMFNLEGFILKLCDLALEVGSNDRARHLRSTGLQALASMVLFMGKQSHIPMEFDKIISVTMENYLDTYSIPKGIEEDGSNSHSKDHRVQGMVKAEDCGSSPDLGQNVTSLINPGFDNDLNPESDGTINPSYWSKICLRNMAGMAKEATTMRRVLEPLFQNFDARNQWSLEEGLALSVLTYMQSLMQDSGDNSHMLLSIIVKHLDQKSIVKHPLIQINVVEVIMQLAQNEKQQVSVAIIGAISDLIKHLRKSIQNSAELPNDGIDQWNTDLQLALEKCISQLSNKVGDVGPILDMLAGFLENIPSNNVVARSTISAVCRTAKMISSVPNVSYHKKAFPDALFHQLLLAMAHPDPEIRVGAHSVFCVVLLGSFIFPNDQGKNSLVVPAALSLFSASQRPEVRSITIEDEDSSISESIDGMKKKESSNFDKNVKKSPANLSHRQSYSFKHANGKTELTSLRLSRHQTSLLLSSIWVQATSAENTPSSFEAMAQTYGMAILFTRSKTSSHMALVRSFQLAFSLRSISLDEEGGLLPSRRRCLFTLASFMLLFLARASNLHELIPIVKAQLTDNNDNPHLQVVDDVRLEAVNVESENETMLYGSNEDEDASSAFLSAMNLEEKKLKEIVIARLLTKYEKNSEAELSSIKEQLLQEFSPDEAYLLGAPPFMETPRPCSPLAQLESPDFDDATIPVALTDDEAFLEPSGSQSDRKSSLSSSNLDILSVSQLLESVLETARQVASFPISSTPIPYDEMKSQCEALVSGKQQKMSVLHSFKENDTKAIILSTEMENNYPPLPNIVSGFCEDNIKAINEEVGRGPDQIVLCSQEYRQSSFRLPPSSPYDKFMKAAGC